MSYFVVNMLLLYQFIINVDVIDLFSLAAGVIAILVKIIISIFLILLPLLIAIFYPNSRI